MTDEHRTMNEITDLAKNAWFWLIPLAGGVADYILQMQRGVKPRAPLKVVLASLGMHLFVAMFFGCLLVLVCGALGYTDVLAFGAAGGAGGFLGVRVVDLLAVLWKVRTGTEAPK